MTAGPALETLHRMGIGTVWPPETSGFTDPATGRPVTAHTVGPSNAYALYYFTPSITPDGATLVFHGERTGWVQLFKLDLDAGHITQLTDGATEDSGWAVWCEYRLRGIYNHLSAMNPVRGEAWYFQDEEIRAVRLDTLEDRRVLSLPGRHPIAQSAFSPDGRLFAIIHADRGLFTRAVREREYLVHMGRFDWARDHDPWRNAIPCEIGLIETSTGAYRKACGLDFHAHHVLFLSNDRLLFNHPRNDGGMVALNTDGSGMRWLRPRDANGTICHQVVTAAGVFYEANAWEDGKRRLSLGRYRPETDTFEEFTIPGLGYVHTGFDPAGDFCFFEHMSAEDHSLRFVRFPLDPSRRSVETIRTLAPIPFGQRYQAHPFLSPDRRRLFHTEVRGGFARVCSVDVEDLTGKDEYWGRPGKAATGNP